MKHYILSVLDHLIYHLSFYYILQKTENNSIILIH